MTERKRTNKNLQNVTHNLKIVQDKGTKTPGVNSGAPEELAGPRVASVVLPLGSLFSVATLLWFRWLN